MKNEYEKNMFHSVRVSEQEKKIGLQDFKPKKYATEKGEDIQFHLDKMASIIRVVQGNAEVISNFNKVGKNNLKDESQKMEILTRKFSEHYLKAIKNIYELSLTVSENSELFIRNPPKM